jgi:squalene cyclase
VNEIKVRVKEKIERVGRSLQNKDWLHNDGWGQRPKSHPDVWTTAQVVYLFRLLHQHQLLNNQNNQEVIVSALNFIIAKQNKEDGGWGLEDSSPPVTATILMVLSSDTDTYNEHIKKGIRFLANSKNRAEGGWSALHQPASATHVTSLIVDCLNIVQLAPGISPNLIQVEHLDPARDFLLKRQNQDGGWGEFSYSKSDAKQTAYAIYALSKVFQNNDAALDAIEKGTKWLKRNYQPSRGFFGGGKGDIEATAIAVWALLAVGESYQSPIVRESIKYLLDNSILKDNMTGWGTYPNDGIQTWLTFFVMIAFTRFLEAIDNHKKLGFLDRIILLFQDKRFTNFLTMVFVLISILLLVLIFIVSNEYRDILLLLSSILGAIGLITKHFSQFLEK